MTILETVTSAVSSPLSKMFFRCLLITGVFTENSSASGWPSRRSRRGKRLRSVSRPQASGRISARSSSSFPLHLLERLTLSILPLDPPIRRSGQQDGGSPTGRFELKVFREFIALPLLAEDPSS